MSSSSHPKTTKGKKRTLNDSSSAAVGEEAKKSRSKKWTLEEKLTLVNCVEPHFNILYGNHSNSVTELKKKAIWNSITKEVNSCSSVRRPEDLVRAQFRHLKSDTKGKAALMIKELGKTGGGEAEDVSIDEILSKLIDMTDWEKKLVKMVGVVGLVGIPGGVDTSMVQEVFIQDNDKEIVDLEDNECDMAETLKPQTMKPKKSKIVSQGASEQLLIIQEGILGELRRIADALETSNSMRRARDVL